MAGIEDILVHAWNKDAVNLQPALSDVMAAKVAEKMDDTFLDVASSMFGNTNGDIEDQSLDNNEPLYDDSEFKAEDDTE